MASKLKRQKIRTSYSLNYLEGKSVFFTDGKWKNSSVSLDKRSRKGMWDISTYNRVRTGWEFDRISEQELLNNCNEVKSIIRDYRLSKINL